MPPKFLRPDKGWTHTLGTRYEVSAGQRIGCRFCGIVLRQLGLDSQIAYTESDESVIELTFDVTSRQLTCEAIEMSHPERRMNLALSFDKSCQYNPENHGVQY